PATQVANCRERSMKMRYCFYVYGNQVRAGSRESFDVLVGVGDHQVAVEREVSHPPSRFDDQRSYRDVWNEVAVHHVDVNQSGPASLDSLYLFAKHREVGGKNRRRDANVVVGDFRHFTPQAVTGAAPLTLVISPMSCRPQLGAAARSWFVRVLC